MLCECGATITGEDRFCEQCGRALTHDAAAPTVAPVCVCGAGPDAIDPDGFCGICGRRTHVPEPRDHVEIEISPDLAAVSDRGKRHARNEDDVALDQRTDAEPVSILIVADGVSSSQDPQLASRLATEAAKAVLASGPLDEAAVRQAVLCAHQAVATIPNNGSDVDPSASTIAIALVQRDGTAIIGWIGDSRIYGIGREGARQLTHDHSWINEVVDRGEMSYEEAVRDRRRAHALCRWIGDQGDGGTPEAALRTTVLQPGEALLACTDGMWDYAPQSGEMAELYQATTGSALEICRQLVAQANARGGMDNVTVALLKRPAC